MSTSMPTYGMPSGAESPARARTSPSGARPSTAATMAALDASSGIRPSRSAETATRTIASRRSAPLAARDSGLAQRGLHEPLRVVGIAAAREQRLALTRVGAHDLARLARRRLVLVEGKRPVLARRQLAAAHPACFARRRS